MTPTPSLQQLTQQPRIHKRNGVWRLRATVGEVLRLAFLCVSVFTFINLAAPRYKVEGLSMMPIFDGNGDERVLISRFDYYLSDPRRGDIIVMHDPAIEGAFFIKRVIGLPHERVTMHGGQVYINQIPLEEPYILDKCGKTECDGRDWHLGANEYIVLGDNRNASYDSTAFGVVVRSEIVGRAWIHYWHPRDWKWFQHHDYRDERLP